MNPWITTMLAPGVVPVNGTSPSGAPFADPTYLRADLKEIDGVAQTPIGSSTIYQGQTDLTGHLRRAWKKRGSTSLTISGSVRVGSNYLCRALSLGLADPVDISTVLNGTAPDPVSYSQWAAITGARTTVDRTYCLDGAPVIFGINTASHPWSTTSTLRGANLMGNIPTAASDGGADLQCYLPVPSFITPGSPQKHVSAIGSIKGTNSHGTQTFEVDLDVYVAAYANAAAVVKWETAYYCVFYLGILALAVVDSAANVPTDPYNFFADSDNGYGEPILYPVDADLSFGEYGGIVGYATAETAFLSSLELFPGMVTYPGVVGATGCGADEIDLGNTSPVGLGSGTLNGGGSSPLADQWPGIAVTTSGDITWSEPP